MEKVVKKNKKSNTGGQMTIDTLAIIMNKSFSSLEKRFDEVDIRFAGVGARFDRVDIRFDGLDTEIEGLKNRLEGVDKRIDDFVTTRVKNEDHIKLKARVDFIEKKLELKSK